MRVKAGDPRSEDAERRLPTLGEMAAEGLEYVPRERPSNLARSWKSGRADTAARKGGSTSTLQGARYVGQTS
jgi:hypothetical protein